MANQEKFRLHKDYIRVNGRIYKRDDYKKANHPIDEKDHDIVYSENAMIEGTPGYKPMGEV